MGKRRRLKPAEVAVTLCLFAAIAAGIVGIIAGAKKRQNAVGFEADYYFLVQACEDSTAAAVVGQVYGAGGAGQLMGGDAVIVACYYTVRDAERVQATMRERGVETQILPKSAEKFYMGGEKAAYAARVEANAETVETCARLLYDAANGLERAEIGQSEARAAARGAAGSLKGLVQGNRAGAFDGWNAELLAAARQCGEIAEGIVFAKDLRRVQARLLCALVGLGEYF